MNRIIRSDRITDTSELRQQKEKDIKTEMM